LKEDAVDYSIYTANIKRKRPTPRKGRKYGFMGGEDDEDDNDDEDWSGGVRRINTSGRKGNSNRGSRQR
jgi:cohesin loading factor subunit SCC2